MILEKFENQGGEADFLTSRAQGRAPQVGHGERRCLGDAPLEVTVSEKLVSEIVTALV